MKKYSDLDSIQKALRKRELSCKTIVEHYLDRIQKHEHLNAFLEVYAEEALKRASLLDKKIAEQGEGGRLMGMVIGLKDNICYKDHKISAASKILEGFTSLYSATIVDRLLAEDAIIIGRLNCDEFAMGSSNENSAFGNVLNPIDNISVPGGSSGGSASAVAADLCLAALGSDTGGSIRQPASFCGIVGFKPTYGRVSRYGLIAYASSFDQIGPLTNNVQDAAAIMGVISGKDAQDGTCSSLPVPDFSNAISAKEAPVKLAYIKECMESPGIDPEVKSTFMKKIEELKGRGHQVEEVSFPYLDYMVPTYYVLTTAEASSNLSRFTGLLYGNRSKHATDVESAFKKSRSEGFGKEVKRRIMLGTFVLSAGYYDAYYAKGQKVRRLLQTKTQNLLDQYQFILLPTTPKTAFKPGALKDPISMYLEDIYTVQSNLTGTPSISIPMGKHSNGLPMGLQVIGRKFKDEEVLHFSKKLME